MLYIEHIFIAIAAPVLVLCFVAGKDERRHLVSLVGGFLTALLAGYINSYFMTLLGLSEGGAAHFLTPVVEELLKMLPILFFAEAFVADRKQLNNMAIEIGLGFAIMENCSYLINYGADDLTFVIIRGFATGVLHPVCVLVSTMGIHFLMEKRKRAGICFLGCFCAAVLLHGTFNLMISADGRVFRMIGGLIPIFLAGVFRICRKLYNKGKQVESKEEQQ